jgi:hypothetical protein
MFEPEEEPNGFPVRSWTDKTKPRKESGADESKRVKSKKTKTAPRKNLSALVISVLSKNLSALVISVLIILLLVAGGVFYSAEKLSDYLIGQFSFEVVSLK